VHLTARGPRFRSPEGNCAAVARIFSFFYRLSSRAGPVDAFRMRELSFMGNMVYFYHPAVAFF